MDEQKLRTQLERKDWIEAAFDALADHGIDGLRVEALAKRCGVTKGSFYWHFKDRQDIFDAVLAAWKEGRVRDINRQTQSAPGREAEQLRRVIDIYSGAAGHRRGLWIELAIRDWARRDAAAKAVVEEVDAWRMECTRKLFLACGFADADARSRSLLLYAYVFGSSLMAYDRNDPQNADCKRWIAERILSR
ncbi:TetR/AcrR family transcriptional regulator [Rhodocyclus purpureus]|uniref:TetR/AcrR family transcriptional regulator n=1 Tax=Rhodocyclus purpureus TaxID=1067 RepID=UPI00191149F4|nr:TetR/AcrR family transcriptional regulator [Rhodocyclus purpureus]MBK5914947.1 TetR family transcriptional regulator [Rhodocyclus purpureus]